jgi:hypothetical protein
MSNPSETHKNQIDDEPTPSSTPGIYVWTKIVKSGSEATPNPISIRKIVIRSLKAVGTDRHEHTFNRTKPADNQLRTETHIPQTLGSGLNQKDFFDSYDVESVMLPVQWKDDEARKWIDEPAGKKWLGDPEQIFGVFMSYQLYRSTEGGLVCD